MLARVADGYLRASIGPCSALIGALDDLHARTTQGLGFLAMEGLSLETA